MQVKNRIFKRLTGYNWVYDQSIFSLEGCLWNTEMQGDVNIQSYKVKMRPNLTFAEKEKQQSLLPSFTSQAWQLPADADTHTHTENNNSHLFDTWIHTYLYLLHTFFNMISKEPKNLNILYLTVQRPSIEVWYVKVAIPITPNMVPPISSICMIIIQDVVRIHSRPSTTPHP